MFDTAERLRTLRGEKKRLDELAKTNNAAIDEAEQTLTERMILAETQRFNWGGMLFYLQSKLHISAVADRRAELCAALRRQRDQLCRPAAGGGAAVPADCEGDGMSRCSHNLGVVYSRRGLKSIFGWWNQ